VKSSNPRKDEDSRGQFHKHVFEQILFSQILKAQKDSQVFKYLFVVKSTPAEMTEMLKGD